MNICEMTALEISNAVKNKEISVKDAVDAFFAAIDEYDGNITAITPSAKKRLMKEPRKCKRELTAVNITAGSQAYR